MFVCACAVRAGIGGLNRGFNITDGECDGFNFEEDFMGGGVCVLGFGGQGGVEVFGPLVFGDMCELIKGDI